MSNDIDLSDLDSEYASTTPPEKGMDSDKVPDGKYIVNVHKAEVVKTKTGKNAGKPRLAWQLIVQGGDYNGRYVFKSNQMATKENLNWLNADLKVCGVVLTKLSTLPSRLGELLDKKLRVTIKNKGDMVNVFLDEQVKEASAPAPMPPPDAGDNGDSEIPF